MFRVKFVHFAVEVVELLVFSRWYHRLASPQTLYFYLAAPTIIAFHIIGAVFQEHAGLRDYSPSVHTVQDDKITSLHVLCLFHVLDVPWHFFILDFLEYRKVFKIDWLVKYLSHNNRDLF